MLKVTGHSLVLSEICKTFYDQHQSRQHQAVDHFNFSIAAGELVTILGPSGCGKTTVLRMIAGFETPSSGEMRLDEKRLNDIPPNQRNSSMVFQSYALFPHMNVEENVCYGLKLRRLPATEMQQRLAQAIAMVGLSGYEKRRPNELSGGQQQRVALARALVIEPDLLLFDEPLSNLDAKLRGSMRAEIRRIQQTLGITAVYVTHDQDEAMAISDKIIIMRQGKIEQAGTPREIYQRPVNRFVADFIGAANFMEGTLQQVDAQSVTVQLPYGRYQIPYVDPQLSVGAKVCVVIRPSNVRVLTGQQDASWQARVVESVYLGRHTDYKVQLANQDHFTVRARHGAMEKVYQPGEVVNLGVLAENLHYFAVA